MAAAFLERHGHSIAALRELSRARLPRLIFDFIDGAAEDERAMRSNDEALAQARLLPRPLNGAAQRDMSVELFGQRLSMPVLIGPTGLAGMTWPRGESHSARAAKAADTVYVMSHASTVSIEELAKEVGGRLWMQVFVYHDRGLTKSFVERAHAAGYQALVITVDNQIPGWRERDLRNGFTVPFEMGGRNFIDFVTHPGWTWRMLRSPRFTFANYAELAGKTDVISVAARMGQLLDPGLSWRDIEWLRSIWDRPLLIKGILHPDEARRAVALGVDGLIVSNHGGRQLDAAPASFEALPGVLNAIDGRVPVLMDGGVRRGADVVKALAMGARACLIGRPQLWGLSLAGEEGVSWVLGCLRAELDRTMALCGCSKLSDIDRAILVTQAIDEGHPLNPLFTQTM
jgi:L-lactate dehydrogenase (cytochrome)/(S)-mandelate dehydrogenase